MSTALPIAEGTYGTIYLCKSKLDYKDYILK